MSELGLTMDSHNLLGHNQLLFAINMYQLVSHTVVSGIVFVYVLCKPGNLLVSYVIAYLAGTNAPPASTCNIICQRDSFVSSSDSIYSHRQG